MARKYDWRTGSNVEATLSVIGGRWKPVILCNLLVGRLRFGELCRNMPNATQRMVTLQLRELESDGVIKRHVFAEVPPRVEYELTELGRSLEPVLSVMREWGIAFKKRKLTEEAGDQTTADDAA
ncbi:helix-turn-helix domain-containing protein [Antarctobacter sp.]|uniref:winged helix-turn-helix transcriptional regulator n=1 Tax=Antarctobacter sp. TaxID=1872577 RepID=UPI002B2661E1|nr:helix-turn-helix domain-containing protein [Antarctobacter sp.]